MQQGNEAMSLLLVEDGIFSGVTNHPKLTLAFMQALMLSCFQIRYKSRPPFFVPVNKTTLDISVRINSVRRIWRAILLMMTA